MKKLFIILVFLLSASTAQAVATEIDLADAQSKIIGATGSPQDISGLGVVSVGDINADGYEDIVFSAFNNTTTTDLAYLVYGNASPADINLASGTIANFTGAVGGGYGGLVPAPAGDVNNDGYDDFLLADPFDTSATGATYLIYGQAAKYTDSNNISNHPKFVGEGVAEYSGSGIAGASDYNGDGYDDLLIGAYWSEAKAGAAYLIYGQADKFTGSNNLSEQAKFTGEAILDYAGGEVASAGDVNADGYNDFLISAGGKTSYTGKVYLFYGSSTNYSGTASLSTSNADFIGEEIYDGLGSSISTAGDVNGDGYDDLLLGSIEQSALNNDISHGAYLIYGSDSLSGSANVASAGVKFIVSDVVYAVSYSVASAGDVNADGYDDILFGTQDQSSDTGAAYLAYGSSTQFSGSNFLNNADYVFLGEAVDDRAGGSVSSTDFNGDGFPDIVIGARNEATGGASAGAVYLTFLYIDSDQDGVAGTSGLLNGTDCDDSDANTYPDAPELQDDVDNNCDGEIDEINTGTHPDNEDFDPTEENIHNTTITLVEGASNGNIKVTYSDTSIYLYNIFNITLDKLTKIKHYRDTGYYTVLHPQAKRIAFVNIYNGQSLNKKKININKKYKYNSLKHFKLRKKYWAVVTSKKKDNSVRLAVIRIKPNKEEFGKKNAKKFTKKIKASKTKRKNNKIKLRNKKGKTIKKYLLTKRYRLKKL